jgi:hypothetical protein
MRNTASILAIVICLSAVPSLAGAATFPTDEAAQDSLSVYRNRFAASARQMSQRMKAMPATAATTASKEYAFLDKANDTLLQTSLLLTWMGDIMRMQGEMCEPGRGRYETVVLDRLRRTRDTLPNLQSLLMSGARPVDEQTRMELFARNQDMNAAEAALDAILERWAATSSPGEPSTGGSDSH